MDATSSPAPTSRRGGWIVAGFAVVLLLVLAFVRGVLLRALLPLALALVAVAVMVRSRRSRSMVNEAPSTTSRRGLELDGHRLAFRDGRGRGADTLAPILSTALPFGVTLFTTRKRDRVMAALSSSEGAFYVAAAVDDAARREMAPLLARASIVSVDEAGLEATGPDGDPILLPFTALADLVAALGLVDPGCTARLLLSDTRGVPVILDETELRVKDHRFDLTAPLEWRAIVFQEAFGQAMAIYQGTWVRQGAAEVILVSLLPSIAPLGPMTEADNTGVPEIDRATLRDVRLMQANPEAPPPAEHRVAIDRLFMLPLRTALDRAPRPSAQPAHATP